MSINATEDVNERLRSLIEEQNRVYRGKSEVTILVKGDGRFNPAQRYKGTELNKLCEANPFGAHIKVILSTTPEGDSNPITVDDDLYLCETEDWDAETTLRCVTQELKWRVRNRLWQSRYQPTDKDCQHLIRELALNF